MRIGVSTSSTRVLGVFRNQQCFLRKPLRAWPILKPAQLTAAKDQRPYGSCVALCGDRQGPRTRLTTTVLLVPPSEYGCTHKRGESVSASSCTNFSRDSTRTVIFLNFRFSLNEAPQPCEHLETSLRTPYRSQQDTKGYRTTGGLKTKKTEKKEK